MYLSYRNEILKAAQNQKHLIHRSQAHSLVGPDGENLFTDYFYSSKKQKKVLLHISGVHGVEGYLGSEIQRQILLKYPIEDNLPFQVIFVHAVNPYGMAWYLRTNSNNVDLNRNGLKNHSIKNDDYHLFKKFLTTHSSFQRLMELIRLLSTVSRLGIANTIRTVASGQSEFADSLFFSGKQLQEELESLVRHLKSIIADDAEIYTIDVHSGLGKLSHEMLIVDSRAGQFPFSFFSDCFHTDILDPLKFKNGYVANGGITELLQNNWSKDQIFHVTQEFGTRPFLTVLNALIWQSQFIRLTDTNDKKQKLPVLKKQMLNCFFPDEDQWLTLCLEKGLLRFEQLLENLNKI